MNNPFKNSDNNKRYLTLAYHNNKVFGGRVYKASLNLGCICPHINEETGQGGCTYCNYPKHNPRPLSEQILTETNRIYKKNGRAKILAYFQTGTNTYCDEKFLYKSCCDVIKGQNVVGISIGTRGDCITESVANMLYELSSNTYLTIELGLQSIHDITAKRINRGHSYKQFLKGYKMLKMRNIRTCIHLINSLPGEDQKMMIETAREVGSLNPGGVKIHMLNILSGTVMAEQYAASPFHIQSREEYVETVVKQMEYFPSDVVMERLTGDGLKSDIIEPKWATDKLKTLVEIDKLQAKLNSYQGKALEKDALL
ncbi:MAG: TIGR01212 family radical SAM protein [Clostridia bacterium]|nr:TIGR01212 family radical SAM protein [Clostridia bacterium]